MQIDINLEEVGGYSAHIPELRIHTQGDTRDELIYNIRDAIKGFYENLRKGSQVGVVQKMSLEETTPRFYLNMNDIFHASYL